MLKVMSAWVPTVQCTKIVSLGVLLEVLYHFGRSTHAKVVQHFVFLVREYSQSTTALSWEYSRKSGIAYMGILLQTQNKKYREYSQTCLKSGQNHM